MTEARPVTVGILLFPDVEVLDFAGPFEVLSVAGRLADQSAGSDEPAVEVMTIGAGPGAIRARHGLRVVPDHSLESAPPVEVLIVPGGLVSAALSDARTLDWLRSAVAHAPITASVCTGAFLLAEIGVLDGLSATTHWEDIQEMKSRFPAVKVIDVDDFIDTGSIITSAGIAAGISMSLHLVERLFGVDLAARTARQMQVEWRPKWEGR